MEKQCLSARPTLITIHHFLYATTREARTKRKKEEEEEKRNRKKKKKKKKGNKGTRETQV